MKSNYYIDNIKEIIAQGDYPWDTLIDMYNAKCGKPDNDGEQRSEFIKYVSGKAFDQNGNIIGEGTGE